MSGGSSGCVVYPRRMRWVSFAAALLSVVVSSARPVAAQPAASPAPLNVMTFNIRVGLAPDGDDHWTKRRDQLFALLRDQRPDILGLQEALHEQITEILAAVPGYAYVGVGRADGRQKGEYSPILYRTDRFHPRRTDTFWFSDTPTVPGSKTWGNNYERICTWAYFEDEQGVPFYAYNLHIDHESQPSREKSAALLLERIGARAPAAPVIVTGDFNSGEQNPAVVAMRGQLRDSFRVMHPDDTEVGTFTAFKFGQTKGDKIDYIFVTQDVDVLDATILRNSRDGHYPSDHFPVIARLRIK